MYCIIVWYRLEQCRACAIGHWRHDHSGGRHEGNSPGQQCSRWWIVLDARDTWPGAGSGKSNPCKKQLIELGVVYVDIGTICNLTCVNHYMGLKWLNDHLSNDDMELWILTLFCELSTFSKSFTACLREFWSNRLGYHKQLARPTD